MANYMNFNSDRSSWVCYCIHKVLILSADNELVEGNCFLYNDEDVSMTKTSPLNVPRHSVGLVAYKQNIYALGGKVGNANSSALERYDLDTSQWTTFPDIPIPLTNPNCLVFKRKIFATAKFHPFIVCMDPGTMEVDLFDIPYQSEVLMQLVPRGNSILVLAGREKNFHIDEKGSIQVTEHKGVSPILVNFNSPGLLVEPDIFYMIDRSNTVLTYNLTTNKRIQRIMFSV